MKIHWIPANILFLFYLVISCIVKCCWLFRVTAETLDFFPHVSSCGGILFDTYSWCALYKGTKQYSALNALYSDTFLSIDFL